MASRPIAIPIDFEIRNSNPSCLSGNLIQLSDFGFLRLVDDGEDARDGLSDNADSSQLGSRSRARNFGYTQVVELESNVTF